MTGRIALIDALRGLAASIVLWHHVTVLFPGVATGDSRWSALGRLVSDRNVEAVLLFFVLSGLSIRLSIKALDMRTRAGVNEYLYRRFRRVLPLYVLSLAVAGVIGVALVPAQPSSLSVTTLLGNLAFLQTGASLRGTWFEPFAENGPLWSLSYEMFYYLAFPLVVLIASARLRLFAVLALTAAGVVVLQVLPNPIAMFSASFLVWYLGVELAELGLSQRASVPLWCFSALTLALIAALTVRSSSTLSALLVGLVFFHAGYALIRLAQRGHAMPAALQRYLIEPLAFVGSFSFGLYLLHFPVLRAVAQLMPGVSGVAVGVLLTAVLAYVTELRAVKARLVWLRRRYV